jgi:hypothetical protein
VKVWNARATALTWVERHAFRDAGFVGAFLAGSVVHLRDNDQMPPASALEVVVVVNRDTLPETLGTFVYHDALLEVSYLPWAHVASVGDVIGSYWLASNLSVDTIILDPTGHLGHLHDLVSTDFAKSTWVRRRCADVRARMENALRNLDVAALFPDQVSAWLAGAGSAVQLLLVAALRNPGGWQRYIQVRAMLDEYGHLDLYPQLLELVGCVHLSRPRVQHHLRALARTLDQIFAETGDRYFRTTGLSGDAGPPVIGGVGELVDGGHHREVMPWIVTTMARCQTTMLAPDVPEGVRRGYATTVAAYEAAVADLNVTTTDDVLARAQEAIAFLPRLWSLSQKIIAANGGHIAVR